MQIQHPPSSPPHCLWWSGCTVDHRIELPAQCEVSKWKEKKNIMVVKIDHSAVKINWWTALIAAISALGVTLNQKAERAWQASCYGSGSTRFIAPESRAGGTDQYHECHREIKMRAPLPRGLNSMGVFCHNIWFQLHVPEILGEQSHTGFSL